MITRAYPNYYNNQFVSFSNNAAVRDNFGDLPDRALGAISELIAYYFAMSLSVLASLDAVGQRLAAKHMVDLVALLRRTGQDETRLALQRGSSAARVQATQAEVLENLDDSDLTIASIAARSNVSPKQVQRLFERAGTTFTEFVLEQRLLLACRLLSTAGNRQHKIGTIAYAAGLGDLSYFNRGFGRRFGVTTPLLEVDGGRSAGWIGVAAARRTTQCPNKPNDCQPSPRRRRRKSVFGRRAGASARGGARPNFAQGIRLKPLPERTRWPKPLSGFGPSRPARTRDTLSAFRKSSAVRG